MPPEKSPDATGLAAPHAPHPTAEDVSRSLEPVVADALEGIVEPENMALAASRLGERMMVNVQVSEITSTLMHQGPLPPVQVAEGYERLLPGSVDRMFRMAERDQEAYIEAQRDARERNDRYRTGALNAGLGSLIVIVAGIVFLAFYGLNVAAAILAGLGVAGIVTAFVNAGSSVRPPTQSAPDKPTEKESAQITDQSE